MVRSYPWTHRILLLPWGFTEKDNDFSLLWIPPHLKNKNVPSRIRWSFLWNTYCQVQIYRLSLPVISASISCCSLSEWIYSRDFPCHNHLRWIVRSSRRNAILWRDSNLSPIPILWHQIFVSWWSKDSQCTFVSPIRIPLIWRDRGFRLDYCSKWYLYLGIIQLV